MLALPKRLAQELLTVGDAVATIGLFVQMVRVLHAQGKLRASVTPGGYRLFRRSGAERLARERSRQS